MRKILSVSKKVPSRLVERYVDWIMSDDGDELEGEERTANSICTFIISCALSFAVSFTFTYFLGTLVNKYVSHKLNK